jgi:hypothetical protein
VRRYDYTIAQRRPQTTVGCDARPPARINRTRTRRPSTRRLATATSERLCLLQPGKQAPLLSSSVQTAIYFTGLRVQTPIFTTLATDPVANHILLRCRSTPCTPKPACYVQHFQVPSKMLAIHKRARRDVQAPRHATTRALRFLKGAPPVPACPSGSAPHVTPPPPRHSASSQCCHGEPAGRAAHARPLARVSSLLALAGRALNLYAEFGLV